MHLPFRRMKEELFAANDGLEPIMKNITSIVVRAWLMRSDIYCLFQRQIDTHSQHPHHERKSNFPTWIKSENECLERGKLKFHEYLWKIMRKLRELVSLMICETFPIRQARCDIGCMHYARIKFITVVNAINGKWIFRRLESWVAASQKKSNSNIETQFSQKLEVLCARSFFRCDFVWIEFISGVREKLSAEQLLVSLSNCDRRIKQNHHHLTLEVVFLFHWTFHEFSLFLSPQEFVQF